MSILDKLTEGIVDRNLKQEGDALLNKWEKTGLLEGIDNDNKRSSMARLLENQAKQLLKEAAGTAMAKVMWKVLLPSHSHLFAACSVVFWPTILSAFSR